MVERGGRRAARCAHTVADWARYVRAPAEGAALFAACRLLVKAGEPARDPRTIACGFWGRQHECPLYEGPSGAAATPAASAPAEPARPEQRLSGDEMRRARLRADAYARRGPLTDPMRQRRRASTVGLVLLVLLAALAAWLSH